MEIHRYPAQAGQCAPQLWIFLPGAYTTHADFAAAGMMETLQRARPEVDIVMAEAHVGIVSNGHAMQRMHEDIVLPARAAGVQQIYLLGISLGGLLALNYARWLHTQGLRSLDGLCLLAPYLGPRPLTQAIARAGGLACWDAGQPPAEETEQLVWQWLQSAPNLPIWLGYGTEDRFASSHALLAAHLPAPASQAIAGGHDWPVWAALWHHFVAQAPF